MKSLIHTCTWLSFLFVAALIAWPVQAQVAVSGAVASSGAVTASGTRYRVAGTFGQPFAGQMQGTHVVHLGFWFPTSAPTDTAIETDPAVPQHTRLHANYPNPFNPRTTIPYALAEAGPVRLAVYDLLGREVARLVDRVQPAARHEVSFAAGHLPSGVYIYRLETDHGIWTRQLTLLK